MAAETQAVTIEGIAAGGDGFARLPGGDAVFVPFTLPGEQVVVRPGKPATLIRRETGSPDRQTPRCAHFGTCGGCTLQHWADAPYGAWKAARLAEALHRAGFRDTPIAPIVHAGPGTRRRMDLALRRTRAGVLTGFHPRHGSVPLDIHACAVLAPELVALIAPLRRVATALDALLREGSAIVNLLDNGSDVLLRTDKPLSAQDRLLLARTARELDIARIAWAQGNATPEPVAALRKPAITFANVQVSPPPGAFLQATRLGEDAIVHAVMQALIDLKKPNHVLADLFSGIGTISLALAERFRVHAFEGAHDAHQALDTALRNSRQTGRVQPFHRDLNRQPLLPKELDRFDAVVLDPPYAGAKTQIEQICASKLKRVIYVSCNPVALAHDGAKLHAAGFRAVSAAPVDQFLWSTHLESIIALSRQ